MHSITRTYLDSNIKPLIGANFDLSLPPQLEGEQHRHTEFCQKSCTAESDDPRQNYLLAALPEDEFERIAPHLERLTMPRADILYRLGEKLEYAYFPTTATISLLCTMEDGASIEVAVVGNEGILGASILGNAALTQATVLNPGRAYRLNVKWLEHEVDHRGSLQPLLMRYTRTLIAQMAQTTGCVRRHSVEQQLCRWLLLNLDRTPSGNLSMTQELMASMLGVRRESITEVAGKLQLAGLISYTRGHIEVLNRPGLETQACECYGVVKKEFSRLHADLIAT
jgi:CRP-like cAMP-binding protein